MMQLTIALDLRRRLHRHGDRHRHLARDGKNRATRRIPAAPPKIGMVARVPESEPSMRGSRRLQHEDSTEPNFPAKGAELSSSWLFEPSATTTAMRCGRSATQTG